MDSHNKIPWYKNYILWLIIILPLLSVTGSFVLLGISLTHNDSPILEGYYKDGLAPQKMAASAESEHITALIQGGLLTLKSDDNIQPKVLLLKLEHPTLAAKDRYITLQELAPGVYPLDEETQRQLRIQHWYVRLYDEDKHWEIKGETPATKEGVLPPFELKAQ